MTVAERLEATPMQVALAWLLRRSPNLPLIPGTSSVAHLRENLAAAELTLSEETMAELGAVAALRNARFETWSPRPIRAHRPSCRRAGGR
nr:aldo/keto reductase [Caulobacter hibisci]